MINVFRIVGMIYIPERSVGGIDLKKLYFHYLMPENYAKQSVSAFMHRSADGARYITSEPAERPEICIKPFIAKRNQKSEQKNYSDGEYRLQYKTC